MNTKGMFSDLCCPQPIALGKGVHEIKFNISISLEDQDLATVWLKKSMAKKGVILMHHLIEDAYTKNLSILILVNESILIPKGLPIATLTVTQHPAAPVFI